MKPLDEYLKKRFPDCKFKVVGTEIYLLKSPQRIHTYRNTDWKIHYTPKNKTVWCTYGTVTVSYIRTPRANGTHTRFLYLIYKTIISEYFLGGEIGSPVLKVIETGDLAYKPSKN